MRKRIIYGLAVAALPVTGMTAHVPPWSRPPRPETRAIGVRDPAAETRVAARRSQIGRLVRVMAWRGTLPRHSAAPFTLGDLPQRLSDLTSRMARAVRGMRLTQPTAERLLLAHHVAWRSNGRCSDRANPSCTSFEGLLHGSLDDLFAFARLSGCPLTISGGTEQGHARGRLSHGTGHKIDVMPNACLDAFIPRSFRHVGLRGDNAELYRSAAGDVFAREASHWDILIP
ncbi:hypothetical protein [Actinomadura logoneensis]|uniref:hypothetical protein n=1 Tax=Actinomadura logoneensis TaxID=2293572 RepID=UPI0011C17588|nr:hypothetical protein [Actinomadura logoneensis]